MRAIIEISDELIRTAGQTVAQRYPKFAALAMVATAKVSTTGEMVIKFNDEEKEHIETQVAMMCVVQAIDEMTTNYERN